ncbi:MAG TPA: tetratricopeptide repeat protein, partial [Spirochaetes bacterium]|nr:tetratricopeptide repeat protein [Spirochaetota bacterium]
MRLYFILTGFILLLGLDLSGWASPDPGHHGQKSSPSQQTHNPGTSKADQQQIESLKKQLSANQKKLAQSNQEITRLKKEIVILKQFNKNQAKPDNIMAMAQRLDLKRGNAYYDQKDYTKAKAFYELALKWTPKKGQKQDGIVFYRLGVISLLEKDYEMARGYFRSSLLYLSANDKVLKVKAHYNLGICFKRLNKDQKALSSFKRALSLNARFLKALIQVGELQYKLRQFTQAQRTFEKGVRQDPKNFYILLNLAKVYDQQSQSKKASNYYTRALGVNPTSYTALYNAGLLKTKEKKWREAIRLFQKAYRNHPKRAILLYEYGRSL